jgi:diamine N-acetyltransferase
MPEAVLRKATPADLPRIAALSCWVWLNSYADQGVSASFARYVEQAFDTAALLRSLQREPMWIIEDGEYLQAWAELDGSVAPDKIELSRLYVAPPCQGQGLGARLLHHVRAVNAQRSLWLSAWEGNAGALRFYRREGATLLGETWFELDGQRHRNEVLGWPALEIQA